MKRRSFLLLAGSAASLAMPASAMAAGSSTRRIGVLSVSDEASYARTMQHIREGLRDNGLVEGRDIVLDVRYANNETALLPRLAGELAALKPAVMIAPGSTASNAALDADPELPVVSMGDMVIAGQAEQLRLPGGRVTGVSIMYAPLNAKRLELLSQVLPKGAAVLQLADPIARDADIPSLERTGRALGLVMHAAYARTTPQIDEAFVAAKKLRIAGINVLNSRMGQGAVGWQLVAAYLPTQSRRLLVLRTQRLHSDSTRIRADVAARRREVSVVSTTPG